MISIPVVLRLRMTSQYVDFMGALTKSLRGRSPKFYEHITQVMSVETINNILVGYTNPAILPHLKYIEHCSLGYVRKAYFSTPIALRTAYDDNDPYVDSAIVATPDYSALAILTLPNRPWLIPYTQLWAARGIGCPETPWILSSKDSPVTWVHPCQEPTEMFIESIDPTLRQVTIKHPSYRPPASVRDRGKSHPVPYHFIY